MNWLLICVIGILVVCALEGYFRGFIKIVFSLLAMIITLAVVSVAAPKITTYIEENTELDERITEDEIYVMTHTVPRKVLGEL